MKQKKEQQINFPELADWVIGRTKKSGADDCRVRLSRTRLVEVSYRERKPEIIKEAITQNLSLAVFRNKRYASQSTPDFRLSTLDGFIQEVLANAQIMEEDPFRTLPDPKYYRGRSASDLQLKDPQYFNLSPENRHEIVKSMEDACIQKGGKEVISVESGAYDSISDEYVKTSNGFEGAVRTTSYDLVTTMTARDKGDRRPSAYHYVSSHYRSDLPSPDKVGMEAADRTLDLIGSEKIPTINLPVIIENRNAIRILSGLLNPLEGSSIQQKRSFLADKKGQKLGSRLLTLYNDPTLPRGLGSGYYDSDGFPARKQTLFTEGMVNEFLIDWYYSRKLGWEPTTGTVYNLIIPPGKRSVNDIIQDLGNCLLITGFIGGNSNSTTGDFSMGILGKLFDKGRPVQNVSEMNIAGNHLNFWDKLVEVANDPWIYSQARLPSLVFDNVTISGI